MQKVDAYYYFVDTDLLNTNIGCEKLYWMTKILLEYSFSYF